ncbi:MAG: divergent PAP2 family protein [Lachnospiraceae bacterium]|nr:divergent PAP2 family protein [Lachnospiraceae bacterium]
MDILSQLVSNKILLSGILSWATAQVIKMVLYSVVNKTLDFTRLVGDGGMPSGHSATVTAIALSIGLTNGFDSAIFALAAIFAIVVMHDAMGVRRETGKQAKVINDLIKIVYDEGTSPEDKLKEFVGHSPLQVVAGFALGILIALLMML